MLLQEHLPVHHVPGQGVLQGARLCGGEVEVAGAARPAGGDVELAVGEALGLHQPHPDLLERLALAGVHSLGEGRSNLRNITLFLDFFHL